MKRSEVVKSVRFQRLYIGVGVLLLIGLVIFVLLIFATRAESPAHPMLTVSGRSYNLELADTEAKRIQGLSDRKSLEESNAMLFVFQSASQQCMWMKDMRFSIDMVWLNEKKEIIKIADNIAPETYPKTFCSDKAKYVLEFAAGEAESINLLTGQHLKF